MKRRIKFAGLACGLCAVVLSAGCPPGEDLRLIYDEGGFSDSGALSALREAVPRQQMAARFVLAASFNRIARVEWWGAAPRSDTSPQSFTVRVFGDNGSGKPGVTPLHSISVSSVARYDTGVVSPSSGASIQRYVADLVSFSLDAGEAHYLSIVRDDGNTWSWHYTDDDPPPSEVYHRSASDAEWTGPLSRQMAFRLWQ